MGGNYILAGDDDTAGSGFAKSLSDKVIDATLRAEEDTTVVYTSHERRKQVVEAKPKVKKKK